MRVLPGLAPIVAGTEAEARALEQQLEQLTIPEYGLDQLGDLLGVDIGDVDLDAPLPARLRPSAGSHIKSRFELVQRIVDREPEITLRRLLLRLSGGRGHRVVAGAPEQIADTIEEWFRAGAADGFNLIPPALPSSLRAFVDGVVPGCSGAACSGPSTRARRCASTSACRVPRARTPVRGRSPSPSSRHVHDARTCHAARGAGAAARERPGRGGGRAG